MTKRKTRPLPQPEPWHDMPKETRIELTRMAIADAQKKYGTLVMIVPQQRQPSHIEATIAIVTLEKK